MTSITIRWRRKARRSWIPLKKPLPKNTLLSGTLMCYFIPQGDQDTCKHICKCSCHGIGEQFMPWHFSAVFSAKSSNRSDNRTAAKHILPPDLHKYARQGIRGDEEYGKSKETLQPDFY